MATNVNLVPTDVRQGNFDSNMMYSNIQILENEIGAGNSAATIANYYLQLPKELSDLYSADWQQEELGADFLNRLAMRVAGTQGPDVDAGTLGDAGLELMEKIGIGGFGKDIARRNGTVKNPLNTLLFRNANLRQFQMTWDFMPIDKTFAQKYSDLLKQLRSGMHPSVGGVGYATPKVFKVKIVVAQKTIFATDLCALTNITYNPFGSGLPAFHKDGEPVHSTLTLEFQELLPLTREKVEELYK